MCKYCEENEKLRNVDFKPYKSKDKSGNYTEIYIRQNKEGENILVVDNGFGIRYTPIQYCFNCGKKLNNIEHNIEEEIEEDIKNNKKNNKKIKVEYDEEYIKNKLNENPKQCEEKSLEEIMNDFTESLIIRAREKENK